MSRCRLGIDIGGTFTDLVMMDEATGTLHLVKLSSTPSDPAVGFLQAVEQAFDETGRNPHETQYVVHGTTVATNTIIEGKGARAGLLTTEGFRDVLEIARQIRPRLYDLRCDKPRPLIPRRFCRGVPERILADGSVLQPLDEAAIHRIAADWQVDGIEAIAVCFLHSYRVPDHERRTGALLRKLLPHVHVSLSSELCPEMREYYRASTTCINAIIAPIVSHYLARIESALQQLGITPMLNLMTSAGGMISSPRARAEPVQLIESGPAAGVIGATYIASQAGITNLISFDMGGTTAKLGLVQNGEPWIAPHFEVGTTATAESRGAGYPVRTPVVDLVEIGAGGGSIAWVDPGGSLRVGPRSAGADPGPACYGNGQNEPCVTDANLVLGRINPDYFVGGKMRLDKQFAQTAVSDLASRLKMSTLDAAAGIVRIANANMLSALQLVSVQRGFDPRDFVLVAFGGAGPLHANEIARLAGMRRVLVPMSPGLTSALGLLVSDVRYEFQRTLIQPLQRADWTTINTTLCDLESHARSTLAADGIAASEQRIVRMAEMRYIGQSFELRVALPDGKLGPDQVLALRDSFYAAHRQAYGYATDQAEPEFVTLRVTGIGKVIKPQTPQLATRKRGAGSQQAIKEHRDVMVDAETRALMSITVYDRYALLAGDELVGPAIVEEMDSTTFVCDGDVASVDEHGNLLIEVRQ